MAAVLQHASLFALVLYGNLAGVSGFCRYGNDNTECAFPCRCLDGICDPDTGECSPGVECERWSPGHVPWTGPGCGFGNVALGKSANQSDFQNGKNIPADRAVDGVATETHTGQHCSYIEWAPEGHWWRVDLGHLHNISSVLVYGGHEAYPVTSFIGNADDPLANEYCQYAIISNNTQYTKLTSASGASMIGSSVVLRGYTPITLCEVVVMGRRYINCSDCPENSTCDDYRGCSKCPDRFRLPDCKECAAWTFGKNCCSPNCLNMSCVKQTGVCTEGCATDRNGMKWIGKKCDTPLNTGNIVVPVLVILSLLVVILVFGGIAWFFKRCKASHEDKHPKHTRPTTTAFNRAKESTSQSLSDQQMGVDESFTIEMTHANNDDSRLKDAESSELTDEVIYTNINTSVELDSSVINLHQLQAYVDKQNVLDGFTTEFNAIPYEGMLDCTAASLPENRKSNRFINIRAYDSTRVVLVKNTDGASDYINANFISGYKEKKAYVAAQAPIKHTTAVFWAMIWQLKANRIVMLTRTFEKGRRKSEQYWPEDVGEENEYSDIIVKTLTRETLSDYSCCVLNVTKGNETRVVRHLQFLRWPDKSTPKHAYQLLAFRRKVRSFDNTSEGPIIVHCSAGIGRTGTFIALDYLMQQAKAESQIDVVTLVSQMRIERMNMVQTLDQYIFLYTAMLEAVTMGEIAISKTDIPQLLTDLTAVDQSGSCRLLNEFDMSPTRISSEDRKSTNINGV